MSQLWCVRIERNGSKSVSFLSWNNSEVMVWTDRSLADKVAEHQARAFPGTRYTVAPVDVDRLHP